MRHRCLLLGVLMQVSLGAACSGEPLPADLNAPPAPPAPEAALTIDFEDTAAGAPPSGFTLARSGRGEEGRWEVTVVDGAPSGGKVLAQTSADSTGFRFPLAIHDGFTGRDVDLAVHFKPVSGNVDQAAGLVWRYRDADNYYVVRANALEDNVVLYKVENGKRVDLDVKGAGRTYGVKAEVPAGAWSELRVIAGGRLFTVYFDGRELFQVEDDTFREAGRVGLWTKADSVTQFDDLRVAPLAASGQ